MKYALAVIVLALILPATVIAADPSFSLADLSSDESLLFLSTAKQPGWGSFTTLFKANLNNHDRLTALTHFPERSRYFPLTGELEIQNRYGLYRIGLDDDTGIRELAIHPSFSNGAEINEGRILPVSSSPDGKWILIQEPLGPVRGNLVLYRPSGGNGIIISRDHVLDYQAEPALWSPDSRYMLYTRGDSLFYLSTHHLDNSIIPDESYREFGPGTLASLQWTGPDSLYYLRGSDLSHVRPSEFFTRSFYLDPLPIGVSAGSIPLDFNPQLDAFWPAPDGSSIIVLKGNQNLFLFMLNADEMEVAAAIPFLRLPGDSTVQQLWWRQSGTVFLLTGSGFKDSHFSRLFFLDSESSAGLGFRDLEISGLRDFVPSMDGSLLALLDGNGVSLRNPDTLEEIRRFEHSDPREVFWVTDKRLLVVGGSQSVTIPLDDRRPGAVLLSSAENAVFDSTGVIIAGSEESVFGLQPGSSRWAELGIGGGRNSVVSSLESPIHRVYLENLVSARYQNMIKIRTVDGFGNRDLFPAPAFESEPDLNNNETFVMTGDSRVFNHGSRTGNREIALVFNAGGGDEGLGEILKLLSDFDLRVTFFVGGDFIRRQPDSARVLAESGHEIGSLFYTYMDMTDFRYRIDSEFIIRGLGRNEDEFFRTTGFEVSTFWHAPWYVVSPSILDATEEMNYQYIGRDVDPLDWVVLDGPSGARDLYRRSPDLVEMTLNEIRPGSIIPVGVGLPGVRDDYFFRKLDLLINGLLKDGYDIVTVSELRDRSR
jgi:peptidoglycan/xylan/chitin deacetylase (PgdA/CDA1 family)